MECYSDVGRLCSRRRYHYRHLEANRARFREHHRYIRFKSDHCLVCGSRDALECHHIIPQRQGGPDNTDNVITLCHTCHRIVELYLHGIKAKGYRYVKRKPIVL
jgi:5-methylcytosine-specific restriction endonuclease McrA